MNRSAKVTSIDAVRSFKLALRKYEGSLRDALVDLTLQVRRAMDWIENDRTQYWRRQYRRASDQLNEARQALARCEASLNPGEKRSCYDEKRAFDKARLRLRFVEEKAQTVRQWIQTARREVERFDGQLQRLNNYLDSDVARAVASLERMYSALIQYSASSSPDASAPSDNAEQSARPAASEAGQDGPEEQDP